MEAATTAFLVTVAIVGGILSPILFLYILTLIGNAITVLGQALINKSEEIKKAPPFDDVEVNVNPATRVMTMRFIKRDKVVWSGSASQRLDDEGLEFKAD